ncbi:hypothetical protein HYU18_00425 [Candidatus Woesearchaeota archaeon]|nr:hypothetical protein [Candidatus Woesearchaeota archaeon]
MKQDYVAGQHGHVFTLTGVAKDGLDAVVEGLAPVIEMASVRDDGRSVNYHLSGRVGRNGEGHFDLTILHRKIPQVQNTMVMVTSASVRAGSYVVGRVRQALSDVKELNMPSDVYYSEHVRGLFNPKKAL